MSSARMFTMFEDLSTKELQILVSMAIQYLEKNRGVAFKQQLKDIKIVHNKVLKGV